MIIAFGEFLIFGFYCTLIEDDLGRSFMGKISYRFGTARI